MNIDGYVVELAINVDGLPLVLCENASFSTVLMDLYTAFEFCFEFCFSKTISNVTLLALLSYRGSCVSG